MVLQPETDKQIWSPRTVAWVWLAVGVVSVVGLVVLNGAGVPLEFGWTVPLLALGGLTTYSLWCRGLDGWGWILVGFVLALLWMLVKTVLYLVVWSAKYSRYGRWR